MPGHASGRSAVLLFGFLGKRPPGPCRDLMRTTSWGDIIQWPPTCSPFTLPSLSNRDILAHLITPGRASHQIHQHTGRLPAFVQLRKRGAPIGNVRDDQASTQSLGFAFHN